MKDRKKPAIRFKGFTEDWEQRKVGEFLTESRVRGNTGLDAKKLTVKLWGKGVVEKNDFGGSEHTQYFTRRKGQFIYSKLDFLNSAFGVIPEKLDNYESTTDLPAFDLDGMNPYFMYFVAIQESFYLKHGSIADGSRKAKRIHADTFLNMPVMVPTIDEQNLIVDFLQHLDNLITLHQRKYDKLVNIKKSMLEKMFPRDGKIVPDIRFSGFTEDWEQRKLGEVLRTLPFKPFLKIPDQDGKYEIIQQGNEPIIGYANGEPCEDFRNIVIFGDHTLSLYKPKQPFFVATDGVRILQGTNDMDGYYLLSLLEGNSPKSEGYKRYYSILVDREVLFTENYYEQVKIGLYFKQLDNLITLHQRKLEKLKNIKKSCLEKMFI